MKQRIIVILLFVLTFTVNTSKAGWVIGDNPDQQQINKLENQVQQQHSTNDGMGIVIVVLAVGTVVALVAGCAIGSRTRRASKKHELPNE